MTSSSMSDFGHCPWTNMVIIVLNIGGEQACGFEQCRFKMLIACCNLMLQVRVWKIGSQSHCMLASMKAHVAAVTSIAVTKALLDHQQISHYKHMSPRQLTYIT